MKKLNVVTVVGTRPEIIRLSRLIPKLDEFTDHVLVHTGQNYDRQLNEVFFEDLELRQPDYFLNVDTTSFGSVMADTLRKSEDVFLKEKPDAVMILGDTNSAIAAVVAERMHIPVYHMEAGNRSFDHNVPEELNRRLVDHVATFNLVYSEHARRNLIREGLSERRIFLTGSPMPEVLSFYSKKVNRSTTLDSLKLNPEKYLVLSLHRQENVDSSQNLERMLTSVSKFADRSDLEVVFSVHPRTAKQINDPEAFSRVRFLKPLGLIDYIALQKSAYCVISDSGSLPEEALTLGFPAVIFRNSMERPEALESGRVIMSHTASADLDSVVQLAREAVTSGEASIYPDIGFSTRVLSILSSTAPLASQWTGKRT